VTPVPGIRHEQPATPGEVAEPRIAASIILLRAGPRHDSDGLEVLLVQRSLESRFMPGVWVFPGGAVDQADGDGDPGLRTCVVRELAEEAGITLPGADALVPFSRWITPEAVAIRFDTWFFAALAPAHAKPVPDGHETVGADWFSPSGALELHERGDLELVFPTIKHLEALAKFDTASEAIEDARGREIIPILPKVVIEDGQPAVKLTGEPGYPED
jgi:8-oxo-dGTP pyrophosphatase MutT (NUDIX family)